MPDQSADAFAKAYAEIARERLRVGKPALSILADDMRRRYGLAPKPEGEAATEPQPDAPDRAPRVDLCADMRRRHGLQLKGP